MAPTNSETVLKINPGAYIWYAHPLDKATRRLEVFYAYVVLDASRGRFGFRLEPRFRDAKLREYFSSNVWVQEAYAYASVTDTVRIKVGKLYSRLGLFWDGTFANLQFFDGLKLSTDNGVSVEGTPLPAGEAQGVSFAWALQYFVVDGATNGSLLGRDTISIPGARRRDAFVARANAQFAPLPAAHVSLGLSGQRYRADFVEVPDEMVNRLALDATVSVSSWLRVLGEYTWQAGRSVSAQANTLGALPVAANFASNRVHYGLANLEFLWRDLTLRAASSVAHYTEIGASETFFHPGVAYAFDPKIALVSEWIYWVRRDAAGSKTVSNGLHFILFVRY